VGVETLGDDLALLAVRPDGKVLASQQLAVSLMGSELVRLAARGKADIAGGRIVVRDAAPTGDAELDQAIYSLERARRPPTAKSWVGGPRRGIADAYLARLSTAGAVQGESRKAFGPFRVTRWQITDAARAAEVKARLDVIARSSGPVSPGQAALGGLVHAAGLSAIHYPGKANRDARTRLKQIAEGKVPGAGPAGTAVADAVRRSASEASDAAIDAATQAAMSAATEAAVHAAVHAATHAAVDAGSHGGAAGGHGH
jgi:Golgi phosphoprotein 3 (GPP34)